MASLEGEPASEGTKPIGHWPEKHVAQFEGVNFHYFGGAEIAQRISAVSSRLGIPYLRVIRDAVGSSVDITPILEAHLSTLENVPEE